MISWTSWSMPPMSRACFMISETEAGKSRSSRTSSQSLGSARGSIGRHSTPIPGARAIADSLGQEISNTGSNGLRVLHQKEVAETGEFGIARLRHLFRKSAAQIDVSDRVTVGPDELNAFSLLEGADPTFAVIVTFVIIDGEGGQPAVVFLLADVGV